MATYTPAELKAILEAHQGWWLSKGGKRAILRGAYLQGADLRGADMRGAYLQHANLQGADLRGAYLECADLRGANLQHANLQGAYLQGADLKGAKLCWQSRELIAEILFRAAGDDIEKRKVAGLILISRDWCWREFLALSDPLRDWALDTLAEYAKDDPNAPEEVKAHIAKAEGGLP